MLAIWSLILLPFLNPAWQSGSSQFTHGWSLAWRILSITYFTGMWDECNCVVVWAFFGMHITLLHVYMYIIYSCVLPCSVQLSHVRLFVTPWITARQASLSITNSQSLLKLMPIESVMPSSHLILCRLLLFLPPIPPSIRVFSNGSALRMRCQSTGISTSASVLPMNTQDWSSLGWTGWFSLQSKGLSRVFSNTHIYK